MQAYDLPRVAVIALAKRIEEVFVPGSSSDPIVLSRHNPGLQLLQRVRDEAHRFALGFHRQRREARGFESIFDDSRVSGPRDVARCSSTSAPSSRCSPQPPRSSRACPAFRRRPRAASTRSCTRPAGDDSRGRSPAARAEGRTAAIRDRNFGPYFVGNASSASGTWFQNLAASLLVYRLTHSAFLLGVLNFCNFVPVLLLAPWAGSAADRFDRRRLLLVTQVGSTIVSAALAALAWAGLARCRS